VTHLPQRLRLDLAHPLAGHVEVVADLFQRVFPPIAQSKTKFQHFPLPLRERLQGVLYLFAEHFPRGGVHRGRGVFVFDKISQRTGILVADGTFERDRLLRRTQDAGDFLGGDIEAAL
jgi:hypothetical protein